MKFALAAILMLATPTLTFAHPSLTSTSPAANAHVKSPGRINLQFSETLEPAFSGAALSDGAGKTVPVSTAVGGKAITLLPMALQPGAYTVTWHGVGHDTHRVSGNLHFTVVH